MAPSGKEEFVFMLHPDHDQIVEEYLSLDGPYAHWTTEELIEYEQRLYDGEVVGEDTWAERDQILWELSLRRHSE